MPCSQIKQVIYAPMTKLLPVGSLTVANQVLWASDYVHLRTLSLVQLIVLDSAYADLMGEHAVIDGTPTLTFIDEICCALANSAFNNGSPSISTQSSPTPTELQRMLDCKLEQNIARAEKDAAELIKSQAMSMIKTCIHMASALTGLETAGGGGHTKARLRVVFKGGTEVDRVVTSVSDVFTQAIMAEDGAEEAVSENRNALFERAAQVHAANAQAAGRGEGVDLC
jgi:carnitine O-acetyltransferase